MEAALKSEPHFVKWICMHLVMLVGCLCIENGSQFLKQQFAFFFCLWPEAWSLIGWLLCFTGKADLQRLRLLSANSMAKHLWNIIRTTAAVPWQILWNTSSGSCPSVIESLLSVNIVKGRGTWMWHHIGLHNFSKAVGVLPHKHYHNISPYPELVVW